MGIEGVIRILKFNTKLNCHCQQHYDLQHSTFFEKAQVSTYFGDPLLLWYVI